MNNDLISCEALKKRVKELLDLAVKRVDDTPNNSPCYRMYVAQENELARLIDLIDEAPSVEGFTKEDMSGAYNEGYACGSREAVRIMNNKAHLRPKDFDSNGDIIPMACKEENGDLISRSKAIEELGFLKHIGYDNSGVMKLQNMEIQRCISVIEDMPAAATDPRPKGKWEMKENEYIRALICSECRSFTMTAYNYCPSCGADMREEGQP